MTAFFTLFAVASTLAFASEPAAPGSTEFRYVSAAEMREMPVDGLSLPDLAGLAPVLPEGSEPERLTDLHLLALTGRRDLLSTTDTQTQHEAFVAMWTPILRRSGFKPGKATWGSGLSILPYEGLGNAVLREFLADPMQFKPKDEADRLANWRKTVDAAQGAGLPVVASYLVDNEHLLATYVLYYVTAYDGKPEHEVRVRILKKEELDPAVLERAGVKVLQTVNDFVTVYIGKEVGMTWRTADKMEDLQAKIEEFKKFLAENGETFIEAKVSELPPGSYRKYVVDLYFFL